MSELAILIPTTNRAEVLQGLLDNIHATTTTPHRVYFIAEYKDKATCDALLTLRGKHVAVFGDFGSCSSAMNGGFVASDEPYVFTGNDDLEFLDYWELPALELLSEYPIVGVNEGHERMTCFAMVRRDFIENESGVFDKPSTLYHEYASQYVDTELADYAKARGVWGEALEGGVIHRHHDFGDADPNHPNYQKARAHLSADDAEYRRRRPLWEEAARCATA